MGKAVMQVVVLGVGSRQGWSGDMGSSPGGSGGSRGSHNSRGGGSRSSRGGYF